MQTFVQSSKAFLLKPREMVRHLHQSPLAQYLLIALLTLVYCIYISTYALSLPKLTLQPLLTLKGFIAILYVLFTIGLGLLFLIYTSSLTIWLAAKSLNGQGTLHQTRPAIIWTLVWSIPSGFFLLLMFLTIQGPDPTHLKLWVRICAYLGFPLTLFYAFTVLLRTIAEVHQFNLWKAFSSIALGLALLTILLLLTSRLFFN
jgi:hypothetical protein